MALELRKLSCREKREALILPALEERRMIGDLISTFLSLIDDTDSDLLCKR